MSVTVYTKPSCVQCGATKRRLDSLGISYETVDMSVDVGALEAVKALGHLQAPVVVVGDENWSGYRPDLIDALAERVAA